MPKPKPPKKMKIKAKLKIKLYADEVFIGEINDVGYWIDALRIMNIEEDKLKKQENNAN